VSSLRLKVLAMLGAESLQIQDIVRRLDMTTSPSNQHDVMSVIGALVQDETIEPDPSRPAGYYRLRRRTGS
jgi:hypothetical protein